MFERVNVLPFLDLTLVYAIYLVYNGRTSKYKATKATSNQKRIQTIYKGTGLQCSKTYKFLMSLYQKKTSRQKTSVQTTRMKG